MLLFKDQQLVSDETHTLPSHEQIEATRGAGAVFGVPLYTNPPGNTIVGVMVVDIPGSLSDSPLDDSEVLLRILQMSCAAENIFNLREG